MSNTAVMISREYSLFSSEKVFSKSGENKKMTPPFASILQILFFLSPLSHSVTFVRNRQASSLAFYRDYFRRIFRESTSKGHDDKDLFNSVLHTSVFLKSTSPVPCMLHK